MQKGSPHAGRALFAWLRGCGGCVVAGLRGCGVVRLRGCGRAEAAGHLRSAGGPEGGDAPAAEQQTEAERCPEGRRGRKVARWPDWSGRSGPERAGAGRSGSERRARSGNIPRTGWRWRTATAPCEAPPSKALPARRPRQAPPASRSLQATPCKPPPCEPLPARRPRQATPCGCVSFRQVLRTTAAECRNG